jgi:hypothetical protein
MKPETFYKVTLKDGREYHPIIITGYNTKSFYVYDKKPNLSIETTMPNFLKVENLTEPNKALETNSGSWERTVVHASRGDILTIETEEQRFVICSHEGRKCYVLFSGDNQMEWPTKEQMEQKAVEVVEAVNRNFVEETLAKICSTVGIDPFNNFDQIVDFIIEDVKTAGMGDFSDENIRIAFRRFVEREM